VIAGELVLQ
jgi:hypothetical protein